MNPRIQELALQAGLQPFEDCGPGYVYKMEKFAELIVRECAGICDKRYVDIGQDGDGWLLARQIAEHFGVEQ